MSNAYRCRFTSCDEPGIPGRDGYCETHAAPTTIETLRHLLEDARADLVSMDAAEKAEARRADRFEEALRSIVDTFEIDWHEAQEIAVHALDGEDLGARIERVPCMDCRCCGHFAFVCRNTKGPCFCGAHVTPIGGA